jgi:predicted ATP-grasp superfamily ATP-dependent carboligase
MAGYRVAVTVSNPYSFAAASRSSSKTVPVPNAREPGYADAVWAEMARHPYLALIPASDPALLTLGVPVRHLVDKSLLTSAAETAGMTVPPTEIFADAEELLRAAHRFRYPVIVKPAIGKPARRCEHPPSVRFFAQRSGPFLVQPCLDEGLRSVAGVVWRGRLVAAVHQRYTRTWPADAGMASAGETTEPDLDLEEQMLVLLDDYDGVFQADLHGRYLLDVNPRPYASLGLAVAAGANLVGIYCELAAGREVQFVRARPGVRYRWLEGDLRHTWDALRRGNIGMRQAAGNLRPRRGTAHGGPESLTDPGPALARLRYIAQRRLWRTRSAADWSVTAQ